MSSPGTLATPVIIKSWAKPSQRDEFIYGIHDHQLFRGRVLLKSEDPERNNRIRPDSVRILFVLLAQQSRVVHKSEIVSAMWGDREDGGPDAADKSIEINICRLRKCCHLIHVRIDTEPTRGYIATVLPIPASPDMTNA